MLETERYCREVLGARTAYLSTVDQHAFYARVGYAPCPPVCSYGGSLKLPKGLVKDTAQTSHKGASRATNAQATLAGPAPPPPPPPPPPITNGQGFDDSSVDEEMLNECKRLFHNPLLSDVKLKVPNLTNLPRVLPEEPERKTKLDMVVCRATLAKLFMKKVLN